MEAAKQHQQVFGSSEPQRLLKTKVQVCARFLLRPEEEFSPDRATELANRAAKDGARIRTSLHLYSSGVRLGESGIFASMPLEYIKYQRVAACLTPGQQHSRMLALCTRDYNHRCVTLIQFKKAETLAEAVQLIDRQRRLVAEEASFLPESPQRSPGADSNWALEMAAAAQGSPMDRRPAPFRRDITVPPATAQAQASGRFEARISVAATPRGAAASARASTTCAEDDVFRAADASRRPESQIDAVIVNYDDLTSGTTYAVFESNHGPPTVLNERAVVTGHSSNAPAAPPASALRVVTAAAAADRVDGEVARPQVTYVTTTGPASAARANGGQQGLQLVRLVPVRQRHHSQHQHHGRHRQPQHQLVHFPAAGSRSLGRDLYYLSK